MGRLYKKHYLTWCRLLGSTPQKKANSNLFSKLNIISLGDQLVIKTKEHSDKLEKKTVEAYQFGECYRKFSLIPLCCLLIINLKILAL